MNGAFLTGLLRGIQRASQQKKAESERAEELKLRERSAGLQERLAGIQEQRELREASKSQLELGTATRQQRARDKLQEFFTTGELREPTVETEPGDVPIGSIPVPQEQQQGRVMGALSELTPAKDLPEMFGIGQKPQIVGPGAAVVQGGKEVYRNPNAVAQGGLSDQIVRQLATDAQGNFDPNRAMQIYQRIRTNPQGAESRIFDYLAKRNQSGQADPAMEQTIRDYQSTVFGTSSQRTAGGETGRLGVRSSPGYQETETNIAAAREAGRTLPNEAASQLSELDAILSKGERNLAIQKPEFTGGLGGIVPGGRMGGITGAVREATGNIQGEEVEFRQNTSDIQDSLLRARSGAQINEQEYKRLSKIAPNVNDQPEVYKQKMRNFLTELKKVKQNRVGYSTTPRGQIKGGGQPQAPQQQIQDPLGIRGR